MKKILIFYLFYALFYQIDAQVVTFPVNGMEDIRDHHYAFTNATLFTDYQTKIENATIIIRNGEVVQTGSNIPIPNGAVVINVAGSFIYPSFIDLCSDYGLPSIKKKKKSWNAPPQMLSNVKGAYGWNQAVHANYNSFEHFRTEEAKAKEWRKLGFGAVLSHRQDGIVRGTGTFVTLKNDKDEVVIVKDNASNHFSFDKGSSPQDYPSSLMGAIALLRQTYYDAGWYNSNGKKKEFNINLQAFNDAKSYMQIFDAGDKLDMLRAAELGKEFGVKYILKSDGTEYQRLDEIKELEAKLITSVAFPKPYEVADPYGAMVVSLEEMKHWELAPTNLARLEQAGISFSLTAQDLQEKTKFLKNLIRAIEHGLSESTALKSLTYNPAAFLGLENQIGSLQKGKMANFIITSGSIFEEKTMIYQNWIQGEKYVINDFDFVDVRGAYQLKLEGKDPIDMFVEGKITKPTVKLDLGKEKPVKINFNRTGMLINMHFSPEPDTVVGGKIRLSGRILGDNKNWTGKAQLADGSWVNWTSEYLKPVEEEKKESKKKDSLALGNVIYPFLAYGNRVLPEAETVLIKNATIWTNEADGIMVETDLLVKDGKIRKLGNNLSDPTAKVIDATGKHLTSGIIDEHAHIAISKGVNEGTQASSAEVRIGDVVNSDDVNIYRQLAGGVVAAQLLHGSANPIGGQSALIKFRWGQSPEKMKIENAPGFIKFALGENVKQSNWGDQNRIRYPQTRMGVEQIFYDYFKKAGYYEESNGSGKRSKGKRVDLELKALSEVLNGERFVTCHSYVQSEINMLMHVADSMNFTLNTFTHILEGYKVADKMKAHGAAASTFSDWWAYKYEVIDAIPYNAALLNEVGVLTGINSDDAEMGRRLNQEAAKIVKYGGVSEEDAWKMVTLNPAKMLHLDDRMGSIAIGKDADLVIWTENPLSIYAKVEQTFVDGIKYFDAEKDLQKREAISAERMRLIQKMLSAKKGGEETQKASLKGTDGYSCGNNHQH